MLEVIHMALKDAFFSFLVSMRNGVFVNPTYFGVWPQKLVPVFIKSSIWFI